MKNREAQTLADIYEKEHFVQMYGLDEELFENLSQFISSGLKNADPCIVIATPAHLSTLRMFLEKKELDIDQAEKDGHIVCLDAAETLAQFMVGGLPNQKKFNQVIGKMIQNLSATGVSVRAFGEMVALLWEQGNQTGAVLLEQLWNSLARDHSFTLYCAYPENHFSRQAHTDALREICSLHSSVIMPPQVIQPT